MKVGMFFITAFALVMLKLTLELMGWFSIAASSAVWVVGLVLAVGWCVERIRYLLDRVTLNNVGGEVLTDRNNNWNKASLKVNGTGDCEMNSLKEKELAMLRELHQNCRRVLRYNGVDKERLDSAFIEMSETTHVLTQFYNTHEDFEH